MGEWEHTSTRLLVDQRTDPTAETLPLLLATCLFHAAATLAALAALWVLFSIGIAQSHRGGKVVLWILFLPAIMTGLVFRWRVKARPTPSFTTKAALIFTATNYSCGIAATLTWPSLLTDLPPLVPMQKWGLLAAIAALSWLFSATAFHIATRGKSRSKTAAEQSRHRAAGTPPPSEGPA